MGYTPQKPEKKQNFVIECPFRFSTPECGTECIGQNCALWLPIQKACSLQVIGRGIAFPKGEY